MSTATAPGKVILVGEHAVVYGRPAIAVPVWEVQAQATLHVRPADSGCVIRALDTGAVVRLADAPRDEPLALVTRLALQRLSLPEDPDWLIELTSEIPMASGLGSGAALSAALVRVICAEAGVPPHPNLVSELVYASEQVYHGAPSGIDNTVVAYGRPIWFVKGQPPKVSRPARRLPDRDCGQRRGQPDQRDCERSAAALDRPACAVRSVVRRYRGDHRGRARTAIEQGQVEDLGPLFDENQNLLQEIGVSTPKIERLADAARRAGRGRRQTQRRRRRWQHHRPVEHCNGGGGTRGPVTRRHATRDLTTVGHTHPTHASRE